MRLCFSLRFDFLVCKLRAMAWIFNTGDEMASAKWQNRNKEQSSVSFFMGEPVAVATA
jgi:hypothetical protein